jgi:hypothetical protein
MHSGAGYAVVQQTVSPVAFIATVANEPQWSSGNVPAEWPKFTIVPGEKALPVKSATQIIAAAESVIARWNDFLAKKSTKKPTLAESSQAIRYLLTISPTAPEFPTAWGTFIRARKVDAEIGRSTRS